MRIRPLTGTLLLLSWFNYLNSTSSTSLRSDFLNRFIHDPFLSNALIILVLFFKMFWRVEFISPNSLHTSSFFFLFSVLFYHFNIFLRCSYPTFYSWLAMLWRELSPVKRRRKKPRAKLYVLSELPLLLLFSRPIWKLRRCAFWRTTRWLNSQKRLLLGNLHWNWWLAMSLHSM
jgi:hypothetical protein